MALTVGYTLKLLELIKPFNIKWCETSLSRLPRDCHLFASLAGLKSIYPPINTQDTPK